MVTKRTIKDSGHCSLLLFHDTSLMKQRKRKKRGKERKKRGKREEKERKREEKRGKERRGESMRH